MVDFVDYLNTIDWRYGQVSEDWSSEIMAKPNFYFGTAASSILLAVMVIAGELYIPLKDLLKSLFSHHWVGKLAIISAVFFAVSFLYKNKNSVGKYSDENIAWYSVLFCIAAIFTFYLVHYFA